MTAGVLRRFILLMIALIVVSVLGTQAYESFTARAPGDMETELGVQRLEDAGIIRDYVALLDPRKLGRPTVVFVEITLSGQADEVLDAFEREVRLIPDVLECHLMAGTADYLLKVVAQDTEDFARIHRRYLARLPGVAQMHSSFALRTVRQTTALPV